MTASIDGAGLLNFRRLSPTLTTSGQPDRAQLAALADDGVKTVINLARPDSPGALADEGAVLSARGVRYVHIPVDFAAPGEADYAAFVTAFEEAGDAMMHVHCALNYRVQAFLYRYRRSRLGWDDGKARADVAAIWEPDTIWETFMARG